MFFRFRRFPRCNTAPPFPRRARAGNLFGLVRQVISRCLDGYNYVIKRNPETTEIVVYGRRGEVTIPPSPSGASPSDPSPSTQGPSGARHPVAGGDDGCDRGDRCCAMALRLQQGRGAS